MAKKIVGQKKRGKEWAIGDRFGRLVITGYTPGKSKPRQIQPRFKLKCDCGNDADIVVYSVLNGVTDHCGCQTSKRLTAASTKHGHARHLAPKSGAYQTWSGMLTRCQNPKSSHYKYYGGRGISVCERWGSFEGFLSDMGERPEGTSIDRINVDGDYCPENCRWATPKQQGRNTSRNRFVSFGGETKTVSEWSEETKIGPGTLLKRLDAGWSPQEALTNKPRAIKPSNPLMTLGEETKPLDQWAKQLGCTNNTLYARLKKGWSAQKTLSTPIRRR